MNFDAPSLSTPMQQRRFDAAPPGVTIEYLPPVRDVAPEWASGVPAFVGYARVDEALFERPGSRAVVLDRWDDKLWGSAIAPAEGSYLRPAVFGFFANGGSRCVLFTAPDDEPSDAQALMRLLAPGGPMEDRSDIDLVCVPDASCHWIEPNERLALMADVLRHCEFAGDRFALLDAPPPGQSDTPMDLVAMWTRTASRLRSRYGALYGPWVTPDPTRDDALAHDAVPKRNGVVAYDAVPTAWRLLDTGRDPPAMATASTVPACGHVAGLIARLDRRYGPQQAPGNESLDGVLDQALPLSASQLGKLNEAGVNCIHSVRGRGICVGGARTLSSQAQWAHISSARVVLSFRRWLARGMGDLAFEPQSNALWDTIRSRLVSHCLDMQQAGALVGDQPGEGFFVKCDAETNPPEERYLGHVVAHIGLAPSVPAEYILVRVIQDASGFTVSGLS